MASAALIVTSLLAMGASYRTQNFIITAATPAFAKQVGDAAEAYRRELAIDWLGRELPAWRNPIPVTVHSGPQLGAGGATSFMFDRGVPFGWRMEIQGSEQRILDSVLPHEVTHTIFATHFGRPLPRWADEGACTTVEHVSEKMKQQKLLITFLTSGRGIAFNRMFAMKEYPDDILPLYSQGYSLARFLIAQGGKRKFIQFVGDGMNWNNWTAATKRHYGYKSLSELQLKWLDWVRKGSPQVVPQTSEPLLAQQEPAHQHSSPAERFQATPVAAAQATNEQLATTAVGFMATAPADGWYARRRDGRPTPESAAPLTGPQAATESNRGSREPAHRDCVARPQPPATPEPIVYQWTSLAGSSGTGTPRTYRR